MKFEKAEKIVYFISFAILVFLLFRIGNPENCNNLPPTHSLLVSVWCTYGITGLAIFILIALLIILISFHFIEKSRHNKN